MQNVIHRVMEAESEAQRILQKAREEAEQLVSEAHRQARINGGQARDDVRRTADTLIEQAVQDAGREKAAQLARAVLDIESGVQIGDPARRRAVAAVVECVSGKYQSG